MEVAGAWECCFMEQNVKKYEHEALIRCLGLQTDAAATQKLHNSLAQVTDWDYFLKTALYHSMFPSLYRRVEDACPEAVLPPVLADWHSLYKINARCNFKLYCQTSLAINHPEKFRILW